MCQQKYILWSCYHHFKATKCDKYKLNTGCSLLQGIFRAQSVNVDDLPMTFDLHGPDLFLASYPEQTIL
jgi:hypothetical protein